MSKSVWLDTQRANMMEALFYRDGRDNPDHPQAFTYTGLWEKFCLDIGARFRDTYYPDLFDRVCLAMDATQSVMVEKPAQQAIEVCRQQLLGEKWR